MLLPTNDPYAPSEDDLPGSSIDQIARLEKELSRHEARLKYLTSLPWQDLTPKQEDEVFELEENLIVETKEEINLEYSRNGQPGPYQGLAFSEAA